MCKNPMKHNKNLKKKFFGHFLYEVENGDVKTLVECGPIEVTFYMKPRCNYSLSSNHGHL